MNAAEIMTKRVITARPDTNVGEIADLLLDHKVSAVPVIDNDRHVVGIVSEGDLLGHPPSGSPRAWWLRLFNDGTVCLEEIATARHLDARDVKVAAEIEIDAARAIIRMSRRGLGAHDGEIEDLIRRTIADISDEHIAEAWRREGRVYPVHPAAAIWPDR